MKKNILNAVIALALFLIPGISSAQVITLGTAADFVLFTTNGSMTNSGTLYLTHLTGNVGSNLAGTNTGFGNVDGVMHDYDAASGQATTDLLFAYFQLNTATPTGTLASPFGSGATLFAGVYSIPTAATLSGSLTLDAQGDPNAVFIFQIQGALSTSASTKVKLINGALACNVYWKVEGFVSLATQTSMKGTIVANNGLINMAVLDTLEGRALSINGAVSVTQLVAYTPIGCGSTLLTGPAAPALDSAGTFGVFSSIGAVTSTPVTYITGNVGSNSASTTGFNPLDVTGTIYAYPNPALSAAASALTNIYNYLGALPADIDLLDPADFGHGLVLTPHAYQVTGVTQFTDTLFLNAEGDANAVFVIKINGAFTTSTSSDVVLMNGTQAKNVYWNINGAVDIYANSTFNGTLIDAGAITTNTGDTLNGRALTINGAIAINGSYIDTPLNTCVAPPIAGIQSVCQGDTTTLTDTTSGGTWSSSNTTVATIGTLSGQMTGITPGTSVIQYTTPLGCVSTDTITVNSTPSGITGPGNVCIGNTITLSNIATSGTWTSSNTSQATIGSGSGVATGIAAGTSVITYMITNGCMVNKTITVNPLANSGSINGTSSVCVGSFITLTDTATGGTWSSSNATATVVGGTVTGATAGVDTIRYIVINTCGADTATKAMTVSALPNAGSINGASSVCVSSSITLTDAATGGIWSVSDATATVVDGVVTGIASGINTISYTIINGCGTASAIKNITVNPQPNAGSINGASSVCVGSSIILTDAAIGGIWSGSNTTATVVGGIVTGFTVGIDTVRYTVTNGCGTDTATKDVTVDQLPYTGSINGASNVCVGSSITLADAAAGGIWSGSNTTAIVVDGIVTGITQGTNAISYTITNGCGSSSDTKTITVNLLPNAGSISGASGVCVSSSITLTDTTTGGAWSSSSATATVVGGIVTGATAGVDTVMYIVTNGCGADTAAKNMTIYPIPNVVVPDDIVLCNGLPTPAIDFSSSVSGTIFNWTSDNTSIGLATSGAGNIASFIAMNTVNIPEMATIIVSPSANGCNGPTETFTILVNPTPTEGTISDMQICNGGTINFANLYADVTGTTYTWINSNTSIGLSASGTGNIPSFVGINNNNASLISTVTVTPVANGCIGLQQVFTITVNINPVAPVITLAAPSSLCDSTYFRNFGTATLPPAGINYTWNAVNAMISDTGSTQQYVLVNFKAVGNATVFVTATISNTGCNTTSTGFEVNIGSTVADEPAQVIYFNNSFVCLQNNEGSYQWGYDEIATLAPTVLTGQINQDYDNANPDFINNNYWVMVTDNGCTQKAYYNKPSNAEMRMSGTTQVTVYPNPASSNIQLAINTTVPGDIQMEVLNMIGQKLYSTPVINNNMQVDISLFAPGIYMINCYRGGSKISSVRFSKN